MPVASILQLSPPPAISSAPVWQSKGARKPSSTHLCGNIYSTHLLSIHQIGQNASILKKVCTPARHNREVEIRVLQRWISTHINFAHLDNFARSQGIVDISSELPLLSSIDAIAWVLFSCEESKSRLRTASCNLSIYLKDKTYQCGAKALCRCTFHSSRCAQQLEVSLDIDI